ncbi:hypothetical protein DXG01_009113 [Tephrocybe rancida]|nr:hypothetical protein DXG01_009113 [Tephrocybe rancida]
MKKRDAGQLSSDKVFADENFSYNDESENNFTLKPVNWGGITTPAHKEKPQSKAPRPRRVRSMSLSSVKGDLKLTKEQDAVLCKASKAFRNAQKTLQDVKDNLGLLNEFKDQSKRINVKIDPEENGVAHLSGSRALRHHDWDTSDQLSGPDSQHGPELIDGHCEALYTPPPFLVRVWVDWPDSSGLRVDSNRTMTPAKFSNLAVPVQSESGLSPGGLNGLRGLRLDRSLSRLRQTPADKGFSVLNPMKFLIYYYR